MAVICVSCPGAACIVRSTARQCACSGSLLTACSQVDDVEAFVHDVTAEYPADMPIFLGGRSMGGLMTLHAVLRGADGRARGVVVTSVPAGIEFTPILRCPMHPTVILPVSSPLHPSVRSIYATAPHATASW